MGCRLANDHSTRREYRTGTREVTNWATITNLRMDPYERAAAFGVPLQGVVVDGFLLRVTDGIGFSTSASVVKNQTTALRKLPEPLLRETDAAHQVRVARV